MASNKTSVNVVFACIVAVLGLTAAREIYINRGAPTQPPATADQLPEGHPSPEALERLMELEQKVAEDPQNADDRTQLANLYYDLGQFEKAADFYQQSLNIRPGVPSVETDLAACFHYLGRNDEALEILDKVLQSHPGFSQAMFNKGVILVHGKNDTQGAIRIWEDLLRLDPAFSQKVGLEQMINQLKAPVN